MKTLATIALSLIAIVASLVFVFSTICAFSGGLGGRDRSTFVVWSVVSLIVIIAAMSAINRLNRKGSRK